MGRLSRLGGAALGLALVLPVAPPAARAAPAPPSPHPGACIWAALPQAKRDYLIARYAEYPMGNLAAQLDDEEMVEPFRQCGLTYDRDDWAPVLDLLSYIDTRTAAVTLHKRLGLEEGRIVQAWQAADPAERAALAAEGDAPLILDLPLKPDEFRPVVRRCAAALGIAPNDVDSLYELNRYLVGSLMSGQLAA